MVFGSIGGILGGAGSIFGAISGSRNQSRANDIAAENSALQAALAREMLDLQTAPRTNARGDVYGYDPERGWYVDLSPLGQQLQSASDSEELARLTTDSAERRVGLLENARRRIREGVEADSLLDRFGGPSVYTPEGTVGLFRQRATQGIEDRYNDLSNRVTTQALRSGTNAGSILADLAEQQSRDVSRAMIDAEIDGMSFGQNLEDNRLNNLLNQYGMLAGRASNIDDAPFVPTSVGTNAENANLASSRAAIGAGQIGSAGSQGAANLQAGLQANTQSALPSILAASGGLLNMFGDSMWDPTPQAGLIGRNKSNQQVSQF